MNKIKMGPSVLALYLVALPTFFGCSAETLDGSEGIESKEQSVLPVECEELGETINRHTCFHGFEGPFVTIGASDPDALDETHNFQTIELDGTSPPYSRTLTFTPRSNLPGGIDDFAIYFYPALTVTLEDDDSTPISSQLAGTIASGAIETCDDLTEEEGEDLYGYEIFELSKDAAHAPYAITFTASVPTISVVVEELKQNAEWWWYDNDGDGYGPSVLNRMKTACVPWEPYTAKQWGDCNDNNASVYPGSGC